MVFEHVHATSYDLLLQSWNYVAYGSICIIVFERKNRKYATRTN